MKILRTIPIIIEQDDDLTGTLVEFNRIQQLLSVACFNSGRPLGSIALHKKCYNSIKNTINSQMTCTAIRMVSGAYSSAKKNKTYVKKVINFKRLNALFMIGARGRDASFRGNGKLSIWTIGGRKKIDYTIPEFCKQLFYNAAAYNSINIIKIGSVLQGRLCLTLEVPDPASVDAVGVDLNETNTIVAVDNNDRVFLSVGTKTKTLNRRTRKTRKRLQKKLSSLKAENKSTRSVVRVLKRLGKKEHRRTLDFARTAAKNLCSFIKRDSVIVFEDLKFKQQRKDDHRSKAIHRKLTAFPHALIRRCITERAEVVGIGVAKVSPYNTSKVCSKCGLIGNRSRHKFSCPHCGFVGHADINAAVNIRNRFTSLRASGLQSISPEVSFTETNQHCHNVGN